MGAQRAEEVATSILNRTSSLLSHPATARLVRVPSPYPGPRCCIQAGEQWNQSTLPFALLLLLLLPWSCAAVRRRLLALIPPREGDGLYGGGGDGGGGAPTLIGFIVRTHLRPPLPRCLCAAGDGAA